VIVKQKKHKDLPIEEGKTYKTRFQTGELFHVVKVVKRYFKSGDYSVEKVLGYEGIYLSHKDLGICPLAADRLVPQQIDDGFKYVCDCCGEEVSLNDLRILINE